MSPSSERTEKGCFDGVQHDPPLVAVVIVNWNGWRDTIDCLNSLINHDYPRLSIIVVDNSSADNSVANIEYWAAQEKSLAEEKAFVQDSQYEICERTFTLIVNKKNVGFSAGNNTGVHYVMGQLQNAEYIFFLNNDCVLLPCCIEQLVWAAEQHNGVSGAVQYVEGRVSHSIHTSRLPLLSFLSSPFLSNDHGGNPPPQDHEKIIEFSSHFPLSPALSPMGRGRLWKVFHGKRQRCTQKTLNIEVAWISGAALLVSRGVCHQIIDKYGFMWKEDYFLYSEDFDLSYRMRKIGIELYISTLAKVEHRLGSSAGGLLSIYYMRRNRSLVCRDHCNAIFLIPCLLWVAGIGLARAIRQLILGNRDIARIHMLASRDGVLGKRGKWGLHDQYVQNRQKD